MLWLLLIDFMEPSIFNLRVIFYSMLHWVNDVFDKY
jgi:hypothetical protein